LQPDDLEVSKQSLEFAISVDECEAMKKQRPDFVRFMRTSPLVGMELNFSRNYSFVRDFEVINPWE